VRKLIRDSEVPKYDKQRERPCPVMDPFQAFIESILEADKQSPVKQRHTSSRINERLETDSRVESPPFGIILSAEAKNYTTGVLP
jgi:hypothetical protein